MDFLRRIFGLSTESAAVPQGDVISITHGDVETASPPPEPIIAAPVQSDPIVEIKNETPPAAETLKDNRDAVLYGSTRPLPPLETVVAKPGQRLTFGQLSDVGMVRGNNQDSMLSFVASSSSDDDMPDFGLFIVADGMGGHHDGEKASAITARIVARHVLTEIFNAMLNQKMNDPDRPAIAEILRDAVQEANDVVTEQIPEGGTTITTSVILGDMAYLAHVGDSRAYLITDDGIEQMTRDHSLVQRLIELDQLTPEEAAEHPQRNVLYRAIGQSDTLDVDAMTRRLPPRARLLLCSDGLWNLVPEDMILETIRRFSNPQEACTRLIRAANDRGGSDNITAVIIQIPG